MITSEEPTVSSTGRYTVTQTCEILGIHRNTLREYTSSGTHKMQDFAVSQHENFTKVRKS